MLTPEQVMRMREAQDREDAKPKVFMVDCHKCEFGWLHTGDPLAIVCPNCQATGKRRLQETWGL